MSNIIITPVYEDAEAIYQLLKELKNELGSDIRVIAVDDGSIKHPPTISLWNNLEINGEILTLCRNVGHQKAITIGLGYISDQLKEIDKVIVMDSDGEDKPNTIKLLLNGLNLHQTDIVVAQRKSRVESFKFKLFYIFYKKIFGLLTGRTISFGNFMVLKPNAVKRLVTMQETSIHVAAAVLASKLRTHHCPIDRGARYAGKSKMNFVSLILHGFKGLMVFAEDVLVRVGIACAVVCGLAFIAIIASIILKLIGYATPGWFSIALGIITLIIIQTGTLALMLLMLTGVVRSGNVSPKISYQDYIAKISKAKFN